MLSPVCCHTMHGRCIAMPALQRLVVGLVVGSSSCMIDEAVHSFQMPACCCCCCCCLRVVWVCVRVYQLNVQL